MSFHLEEGPQAWQDGVGGDPGSPETLNAFDIKVPEVQLTVLSLPELEEQAKTFQPGVRYIISMPNRDPMDPPKGITPALEEETRIFMELAMRYPAGKFAMDYTLERQGIITILILPPTTR